MQQQTFAVAGDTLNEEKYAYKIKQGLIEHGYTVHAVGKELASFNDIPGDIDIIDLCIHPAKGLKLMQECTKSFKCIVIQPGAESPELLAYLDELDSVTTQMAELEVPTQFASVENLADEASENMTEAVQLYHQLYASEEYNEDLASGAYEYYERANMRIRYITDILHGDIPEELQEMMKESDEGSEEE